MSLTRRLAVGLSAAGVTALAALALSGSAAAAGDEVSARAARPVVMATPCAAGDRGDKCTYGGSAGPTRGNGGYGTESPSNGATTSPTSPTPGASVDTVPPGGELPATSPAVTKTPGRGTAAGGEVSAGGGVSAGGTLPLTGAPMGVTVTLGGLLVLGGVTAVYYTRRRRNA